MCPNWCFNSITISHDDPAMIDKIENSKKTFPQELIPCPHNPETSDKWYDWRVNNWGCKWTCELDTQRIDSNTISANFDSAWSPPIEAYNKLTAMGFRISAFYYETGMGFAGRFESDDEGAIHTEETEINFSNENWTDEMSDELADFLMPEYENWQMWNDEQEKTNDAA